MSMAIFRALEHRNFRLFFVGQGISLIGMWTQQVAMGWLVYRLTGSAFILGLVAFANQFPVLLSPLAGVLADRWDRRKVIIITQILAMVQAFVLGALTLLNIINVNLILVLGIFLGAVNAIEMPTRHSFILDMVERKDLLGNAIALNSLMFNLARLIGPAIAGIIIAMVGEGPCFMINGASFIAALISLFMMDMKPKHKKGKEAPVLHGLMEGMKYTFGFAPIRYILILIATVSLMGTSYVALMPVFAKNVLNGGPQTFGFLVTAIGVGAVIATIILASRKRVLKLGRIVPASSALFAAGLVLFSMSRNFWIAALLLTVSGFGFMFHMAASNTILQTIADDDKRGRVMSFYAFAFLGIAPFGSLIAGSLATAFGVTNALMIGGFSCLIVSAVFAHKIHSLKRIIASSMEIAVPETS